MLYAEEELVALKEQVAGYPKPLLSVYLSVNPAHPENRGKAYVLRLKNALKAVEAPKDLSGRVLAYVEAEQPRATIFALFASPEEIFDIYRLRVELPERVRWGEPYVAPLIQALQQYEPYGVVLIDAHRARFFVSAFGRMEEEVDAKNVFTTVGWREVTISPSTAAPSGGLARDVFEHRIEAQTLRFYRELEETVRGLIERFGLVRLILAGPEERTSTFLRTLPGQTARMVAATVPLPLGTYPLPITPVIRDDLRYQIKVRTLGHERYLHAGRCAGVHLHLGLPAGAIDPHEAIFRRLQNHRGGSYFRDFPLRRSTLRLNLDLRW